MPSALKELHGYSRPDGSVVNAAFRCRNGRTDHYSGNYGDALEHHYNFGFDRFWPVQRVATAKVRATRLG
jgi:hypothetical protein